MAKQILLLRQGKKDKTLIAENNRKSVGLPISDKAKRAAQRMGIWIARNDLVS